MGATTNEVSRIRKAGDHQDRRAVAPASQARRWSNWASRAGPSAAGMTATSRAARRRWRIGHRHRAGYGTVSRRNPRPDHRAGAGAVRALPARAGRAVHRREALLRVGSHGLPPAEGPRSDHQPGLCRDQSRRSLPHPDHPTERDVADRLHLLQDHRLGLDVSVDRAGRLLALHHRLEAVQHDAGRGRDRHAGHGAGSIRLRSGPRASQATPAVG